MHFVGRLVCLALLCWLSTGSGRVGQLPIAPQPLRVDLIPVGLDPSDPRQSKSGALRFIAGYALHARAPDFGGWSAMLAGPRGLRLVSDAGAMLDLPVPFGASANARLAELPKGCGSHWNKEQQDAEAATQDPRTGRWWVTLERLNLICRIDGEGSVKTAVLPAMADWESALGAEAVLRMDDGRFLIFAEGNPHQANGPPPVLLYDRDPLDPAARVEHLSFQPPRGFRPVDAAQLPDGRILVLVRSFELPLSWRTRILVLRRDQLSAGARLMGTEIARLEAPRLTDNFEAMAVTQEKRRTIIWLASDDNFWPFQQSYLLKFALED